MGLAVSQLTTKISFSEIAQRNSENIIEIFEKRLHGLHALQEAIKKLPPGLESKIVLHGSSSFIFFCAFQRLLTEEALQYYADYIKKADFDLLIMPDNPNITPQQVYNALRAYLIPEKFKILEPVKKIKSSAHDSKLEQIPDISASYTDAYYSLYPSDYGSLQYPNSYVMPQYAGAIAQYPNSHPQAYYSPYPYDYGALQYPNSYVMPQYAAAIAQYPNSHPQAHFSPYPVNYASSANEPALTLKKKKEPAKYLHIQYENDGQEYDVTCVKNCPDENHGQLPWLLKAEIVNAEIIFVFKDDANLSQFNDFFEKGIIRVTAIENFDIKLPVTDNFIRLIAFLCKSLSRYSKMRTILLHQELSMSLEKIFENAGLKSVITSKIHSLYGSEEDFYKFIAGIPVFFENLHANSPESSAASEKSQLIDIEINTPPESDKSPESLPFCKEVVDMNLNSKHDKKSKSKKEKVLTNIIPMPEPLPVLEAEFETVKKGKGAAKASAIVPARHAVVVGDSMGAQNKADDSSSDSEPERTVDEKKKSKNKPKKSKDKKQKKMEEKVDFRFSIGKNPRKNKVFDKANFASNDMIDFVFARKGEDFSVEDLKKCLRVSLAKSDDAQKFVVSVYKFLKFVSKWIWYFDACDISHISLLSSDLSEKYQEYIELSNIDEIKFVVDSMMDRFKRFTDDKESAALLIGLLKNFNPVKKENFKNDLEAVAFFKRYVNEKKIELSSDFNILTAIIFSQVSGLCFFKKHLRISLVEFYSSRVKSDYIVEKFFVYNYLKAELLLHEKFAKTPVELAENIKKIISVDSGNFLSRYNNKYYSMCSIINFYDLSNNFEENMKIFFGSQIFELIFNSSETKIKCIDSAERLIGLFFKLDLFSNRSLTVLVDVSVFLDSLIWYFGEKLILTEKEDVFEKIQFLSWIKESILTNGEKWVKKIELKYQGETSFTEDMSYLDSYINGFEHPVNEFLKDIILCFYRKKIISTDDLNDIILEDYEVSDSSRLYFESKKNHITLLCLLLNFAANKPDEQNVAFYFHKKSSEILEKIKQEVGKMGDDKITLFDFYDFLCEALDVLCLSSSQYSEAFLSSSVYVLSRAEIYAGMIAVRTSYGLNIRLKTFSINGLTVFDKIIFGIKNKILDKKYSMEILVRLIRENFEKSIFMDGSIKMGIKDLSSFPGKYFSEVINPKKITDFFDYINIFYDFYRDPIFGEKLEYPFGRMTPSDMWHFIFEKCGLKKTYSFKKYMSMIEGAIVGYYAHKIVNKIGYGNAAALVDSLIFLQENYGKFYNYFVSKADPFSNKQNLSLNLNGGYDDFIYKFCNDFENHDGIDIDTFLLSHDDDISKFSIDYLCLLRNFLEIQCDQNIYRSDLYDFYIMRRVEDSLAFCSDDIFIGGIDHFDKTSNKNDILILCMYYAFVKNLSIPDDSPSRESVKIKKLLALELKCRTPEVSEDVFLECVFDYIREVIHPKDENNFIFWCGNVIEACVRYKTALQICSIGEFENKLAKLKEYKIENSILINSLKIIEINPGSIYKRYQKLDSSVMAMLSFQKNDLASEKTNLNQKCNK